MSIRTAAIATLVIALGSLNANAQVIGSFTWQTQPYCNRVALTVVQQGGVYQLTGSDDQCGAGSAPVTGTAVPTAGGVAMGFAVAQNNGGAAHVSATISLATLSGTWSDGDGNTGTFAFSGAGGGAPRPAPATLAAYATAIGGIVNFGAVSTPVTVSTLTLPAGHFVVNAAVVANNNDGTSATVGCTLVLGSTTIASIFDTESFILAPTGTPGERESIALTGAGTLAAAGTARIVCRTSATSGNYLAATIVATKVASLTKP